MNWQGLKTIPWVVRRFFFFFSQGLSPEKKPAERRCLEPNLKQCSAALSASAVCLWLFNTCVRTHVRACRLRNFSRLLLNSAPGNSKPPSGDEFLWKRRAVFSLTDAAFTPRRNLRKTYFSSCWLAVNILPQNAKTALQISVTFGLFILRCW